MYQLKFILGLFKEIQIYYSYFITQFYLNVVIKMFLMNLTEIANMYFDVRNLMNILKKMENFQKNLKIKEKSKMEI